MIFQLEKDNIAFPPPSLAEPDGLLAIGGDLSTSRLTLAYEMGIFPWFSEDTPILWYSPHERFVLYPQEVAISKSMRKLMRTNDYTVTRDTVFEEVIRTCATTHRTGQESTWITPEMQKAYISLHHMGKAHSVEVWNNGQLIGGLYGVSCGVEQNVFCGESMFSSLPNASKLALISLCLSGPYGLIDCQIESTHLKSLGARTISRKEFMAHFHLYDAEI